MSDSTDGRVGTAEEIYTEHGGWKHLSVCHEKTSLDLKGIKQC